MNLFNKAVANDLSIESREPAASLYLGTSSLMKISFADTTGHIYFPWLTQAQTPTDPNFL